MDSPKDVAKASWHHHVGKGIMGEMGQDKMGAIKNGWAEGAVPEKCKDLKKVRAE